jgi:hypothetical protein
MLLAKKGGFPLKAKLTLTPTGAEAESAVKPVALADSRLRSCQHKAAGGARTGRPCGAK